MDSSEGNDDKITPERSSFRTTTNLIKLIIILQVLVALVSYFFMPDIVPTHWNAAGQVNGHMPKLWAAILFPLTSLGVYVLVRVLVAAGPRLGNQSQRANKDTMNLILIGVLLFTFVLQLTTTAIALGIRVDIILVTNLALSVLFIFIGNYMVKLRRNFWGGVRTPWTLSSDIVWERTNRLGGWLFVLGGFLGLVMSFIPFLRLYGIIATVIAIAIITTVYSYLAYQRYVVNERRPSSPPFDSGDGA